MVKNMSSAATTPIVVMMLLSATTGDIPPGVVGNVLMSNAWASGNHDAAQRFVTGWLQGQRDYYHAFGAKDNPALQPVVVSGVQPRKVDLAKVIDRSYVDSAVKQLGRV